MPALMAKPSFDSPNPKKGKKVTKEYGGGGGASGGSGSEGAGGAGSGGEGGSEEFRKKKSGGKRSFLQQAKKFGKQGKLGKGSRIDAEMYSYFVRILELLRKDEFDTVEDREALVENSLTMAEKQEVELSSNQLVSRVIENILPLASEDRLEKFCNALTPNLRVIVADPFASHVLEKLLEVTSSDNWRSSEKLTSWFEKTSKFVLNNFEDFTFDTYGSFVTKKVLECLSGNVEPSSQQIITGSGPPKGSKCSIARLELYGKRTSNPKWEKLLQEFGKRFAAWPQFNDLGERTETSRLLQNVIQSVSKTENSEPVVKELITRVLGTLPETLEPNSSLHRILEVCLPVADKKLFGAIYKKYYKGHLEQYIFGACFTLQKLIDAAPTNLDFTSIFDELAPQIKSIFREGRTILIHSLATQCATYGSRQQELWKLLKDAFKVMKKDDPTTNPNILLTLATVKPKSDKNEGQGHQNNQNKFSTTFYGASTVQILFDFDAAVSADVLKSFSEITAPELLKMSLDPKASFIISKIFKSWKIPEEHKALLLTKLEGSLLELATTKFGSRIIDLIWLWADLPQKTMVATNLSQRIPVLSANKYGRFIVETQGLQALIRNQKEWKEHIASQDKRQKQADNIATELGLKSDSTPEKSSKKAKKRKSEAAPAPETPIKPEEVETPTKSKKKNRKSEIKPVEEPAQEPEEIQTPKKSRRKNRKSKALQEESPVIPPEDLEETLVEEEETPKKKKKKNRKSEKTEEMDVTLPAPEIEESSDTPSKKKKKRASKQF